MKKYFSYVKTVREVCQKPCIIDFEGKPHTSFCNAHSLALTTEPCGAIELYTDVDRYPDVGRLVRRDDTPKKVNFAKVFANAKARGYKLSKKEVNSNHFMLHYDGAYFRLGLFDITYRIIDNGDAVAVYHKEGDKTAPMTLENGLGVVMVLPVRCDDEFVEENGFIVIEVE